MSKVKLIIIFNHKYLGNLEKLRSLYKTRFTNIVFLMPFYDGNDTDVLSVSESSYFFHGFISQVKDKLFLKNEEDFYYVFIGDDLVLNPSINEFNILETLGMSNKDVFLNDVIPLSKAFFWNRKRFENVSNAFLDNGVNYIGELPSFDEALKMCKEHELSYSPLNNNVKCVKDFRSLKSILKYLVSKIFFPIKEVNYPLYCGYSDFFVISNRVSNDFSRLCGVFSSMNLFVEVSIPTISVMVTSKEGLATQKDSSLIAETMWMRTPFVDTFEKECDYNLDMMPIKWPQKYLYLHPIKLSKWKMKR